MITVKLWEILQKKVLVTRESARVITEALRASSADGGLDITIDFTRIEGVTPSFVDETLTIVKEWIGQQREQRPWRVLFVAPPTRLTLKFATVAKAHELEITETASGTWILTSGHALPVVHQS